MHWKRARVIGVDLNGDGMPDGVEPVIGDVTAAATIARAVETAGTIHGLGTIAGISRSGAAIDELARRLGPGFCGERKGLLAMVGGCFAIDAGGG